MPFNGPPRELPARPTGPDFEDDRVYCTQCGTIFVSCAPERSCPACTLADQLDEIEQRLDDLETDSGPGADEIGGGSDADADSDSDADVTGDMAWEHFCRTGAIVPGFQDEIARRLGSMCGSAEDHPAIDTGANGGDK